jgi:hypothetical protein
LKSQAFLFISPIQVEASISVENTCSPTCDKSIFGVIFLVAIIVDLKKMVLISLSSIINE